MKVLLNREGSGYFGGKGSNKLRRCIRSLLFFVFVCYGVVSFNALAYGQEDPSGALDFGLSYSGSMGGHHGLGVFARAMAVDRVPDTVFGRFAELYVGTGVGLDGEFISYSLGAKFGVGFATKVFVLFLASGLMVDAYQSIKKSFDSQQVRPGLGLPLVLGLWLDVHESVYLYGMVEPSWSFWGKGRKTKPFVPFNFARELRFRGGIGFKVESINMRVDYQFHQVSPYSWHTVSLGIGYDL